MIDWQHWIGLFVYRINRARTMYTEAILSPTSLPVRVVIRLLIGMLSLCILCALIAKICLNILIYAPFLVALMVIVPILHVSFLLPVVLLVALGPFALMIYSVIALVIAISIINICVGCVKTLLIRVFGRFWNRQ